MKIIRLLVALVIAYIAIIPPAQLLWNTQIFKKIPISTYEKAHKWRYDHGSLDMYPGCAYIFPSASGGYIGYCLDDSKEQSNNDLNAIPLDIQINVPKSFLSELLHVPNSPLEQKVCFNANNFFKDLPANKFNAETRVFLYPKPITELKQVDERKIIMETFSNTKCIKAMSGMTLIGVGNGNATIFDRPFFDGIEKSAKFTLPILTHSGGKLFVDKKEVEKRAVKKGSGYTLIETEIPIDTYEFSVITHLDIYSQTPFEEKVVLVIAIYSVWLLAIKALIENAIKLSSSFFKILTDGIAELVIYWLKFQNKVIGVLTKIGSALTKLVTKIKILIKKILPKG